RRRGRGDHTPRQACGRAEADSETGTSCNGARPGLAGSASGSQALEGARRRNVGEQNARRGRAVSVYLDATALAALSPHDPFSPRAGVFLRRAESILIVSDFAAAEFASAIARQVRTRDIARRDARIAFSAFDTWIARVAQRVEIGPPDVTAAEAFLRRLDLN